MSLLAERDAAKSGTAVGLGNEAHDRLEAARRLGRQLERLGDLDVTPSASWLFDPSPKPCPELLAAQLQLEGNPRIVGIGPAKLAAKGRQVRQSQKHISKLADRRDGPQPGPSFGDIVKIACIVPIADMDSGPALDIGSGELAPLGRIENDRYLRKVHADPRLRSADAPIYDRERSARG